jgi:hypothetical protein
MEEDETINFIPHPNTLTTTGDQNYRDNDRGKKAFPFAIAEKIVSVTRSNIYIRRKRFSEKIPYFDLSLCSGQFDISNS